jgi:signal transduction histidine kinase
MAEGAMRRTTDLVLLVWESGHYLEYEPGAPNTTMEPPDSRPHLDMILPESIVASLVGTVKAVLQTGAVHRISYTLEMGARLEFFRAQATPFHQKYALLLLENVTESEETSRTLRQHNALLQVIFDNVSTEISVFDRDGNRILQNRAAAKNEPSDADSGSIVSETVIPGQDDKSPDAAELPLVKAFRGEAVLDQIVVKCSAANGSRTYLVNALPLTDEAGKATGVLLTEREISDLRKLQTQLKSKSKDFDMFMYRASHDLKSPLTAMEGVLVFALSNIPDSKTRMYLELIRKSHGQLSNTVNDLITLSRISQKEIQRNVIRLSNLVQEIVGTIRLLPQAEHIEIKDCIPEHVAVSADEGLLRAVLQNLIWNAIVHHRPGGAFREVQIVIQDQEGNVRIEVSDNGPGIPADLHDKIYDIFFRGNPAVAGSGVGLFIVKQAVERLSGSIEMVSEEGTGSTFTVVVPNAAGK